MNRLLILLLIVSSLLHAEVKTPILKYPESMTWKGIFDAPQIYESKYIYCNLKTTDHSRLKKVT